MQLSFCLELQIAAKGNCCLDESSVTSLNWIKQDSVVCLLFSDMVTMAVCFQVYTLFRSPIRINGTDWYDENKEVFKFRRVRMICVV